MSKVLGIMQTLPSLGEKSACQLECVQMHILLFHVTGVGHNSEHAFAKLYSLCKSLVLIISILQAPFAILDICPKIQ